MLVKILNDDTRQNPVVKVMYDGNFTTDDSMTIILPDCGLNDTIKTLSDATGAKPVTLSRATLLTLNGKPLIKITY